MAIRNIFKEGEPVLRQKSKTVSVFDDRLHTLLDDMFDTMIKNNGCGIAAPQVGILKRAVIIWHEDEKDELINPEIISEEGSAIDMEGCLSVDSAKNCLVNRPEKITVNACDRFGTRFTKTVEGWRARIYCHEIDHLNGILFIDKEYKEKK